MSDSAGLENHVLMLMPSARDAEVASQLLRDAGIQCASYADLTSLCAAYREQGAGAVLVTDDVLLTNCRELDDALYAQQPWSALPIVVLARESGGDRARYGSADVFKNVQIVDRPVRVRSLISAIESALRARRNQYQIRAALVEREQQAARLREQDDQLRTALDELNKQAEQLRTADRLKDEFLATLAHELRNPLAPVRTGLSLLQDMADPAQSKRTLEVMQRQVNHMTRLIDDLLDVSRITRGKLELRVDQVALADVMNDAIEDSTASITRGGHTLETRLPDASMQLRADRTRLAQVIANLLTNASKYTPAGGKITLTGQVENDEAIITVSDTGLGIPAEHLDSIFEMFSQLNGGQARAQGGLGIGLSLVRRLVSLHGGTVSATSAGPGLGSTFTVRLPCTPTTVMRAELRDSATRLKLQDKRILVVDDNDDAAELLALMLQQAGHHTTMANDGPSALAAVAREQPEIVILDIGLPGMSGHEVAQQLRSDPRLEGLALIALTGWGTDADKRKAMAAGFDVHLTKPVAANDLHAAIAQAVAQRLRQQSARSR